MSVNSKLLSIRDFITGALSPGSTTTALLLLSSEHQPKIIICKCWNLNNIHNFCFTLKFILIIKGEF